MGNAVPALLAVLVWRIQDWRWGLATFAVGVVALVVARLVVPDRDDVHGDEHARPLAWIPAALVTAAFAGFAIWGCHA